MAQELPPIEKYLPESYEGETQNWSISQATNKNIYIANNEGLLEFNGADWTLYPTPNRTVMRSVNVVDDRIYTGCYMNFGYWKKNDLGKLKYISISDTIKDQLIEDEQFWGIVYQDNWVLFQSLQRIYMYNTTTQNITIIDSQSGIRSIFNVDGIIYYQDLVKGIFRIEKGKPILVTNSQVLANDKVVSISGTQNNLLILTSNNGFYRYTPDSFSKWAIAADEVLRGSKIYSGIQLKNENLVLGTISKGIIYLSSTGDVLYQIDQNKGLSNNTVLSVYEDIERNVWIGLDNGINCINITSPITLFNDEKGNLGTVYASVIFNDHLYLGTNQGLFYKKVDTEDTFQFVKGTNGQVWSLFVYDDTLFCGHDSGTFIIDKNESELVSEITGAWNFKTIPGQPNNLLQGTYSGLSILEKTGNSWSFKHVIEGFNYSARYVEVEDKTIWVNHEYRGLFKLTMDDQFSKIIDIVEDFSIEKGRNSNILKFEENILYTHETGIYSYNKQKKIFEQEYLISKNSDTKKEYIGKLITDNIGGLWSFSDDYLGYISYDQFSEKLQLIEVAIPRSLRKEMFGFENITYIKQDSYLLGTTNGYMIIELSRINFKKYSIFLNKIEGKNKGSAFETISLLQEEPTFESQRNTFKISYTVPEYDKFLITKFQYKLEGFYEHWSGWSTNSTTTFENLPFGSYTFKVRAKTGNILSDNTASYSFNIARPWYFSMTAIFMYSLVLIGVLFLTHKAYKNYYAKQKQKLVEYNKRQLALKALESEREIMKLNNEKLMQDVESKNRELATSTMNIIKKNEILNTIKKELQKSEAERSGLTNVERIIDRNLNNKDDWRHFEEAFNNVDKDFLKKLKVKHDKLTPNDLRFCTYLRLNLSSKEIAPLLNISVRSVEIKRYRLRKKLDLKHEESLVNYILDI
ncbi:triple tyrosine motif-containing protein [Aquimarina intermedia]|uniref:Regulatory LuxR family protein n=1 Tax=Aquimarina intermedia TaxID=350814 RepID=A0A5S5C4W4_9FLAO|nr:triple tyrosine motif-containing protein [Aquimarina intermedia]TYP74374.1 regulatory LuxR family protein [Aquimarina intermedia]